MPRLKTLQNFLPARLRQRIQPLARWSISRALTSLGMVVESGGHPVDTAKPTAIVVSHEASTTGAPILALNLAQQLSRSHNVVVMLLRGGTLRQQFQNSSTALIQARRSFVASAAASATLFCFALALSAWSGSRRGLSSWIGLGGCWLTGMACRGPAGFRSPPSLLLRSTWRR